MQIRFIYSSNTLRGRDHVETVLAQFPVCWEKHQINGFEYHSEVSESHIVTICVDVVFSNSDAGEDKIQTATRTLRVFADLSRELGVDWNVGHELEPHLGSIAEGQPSPKLADEIRMALNVAQSLAGIIVDDEFIEPDSMFDDETLLAENALPDEDSWNGLLESEDPFIRFPEFD